ncbi:Gfo/Idh/MocA family protein [Tunicatimonas pelagia]|uniref:Gfo/Idh/MocA family protein n=1 Tax=Tunicatimonas pelagia TaxID=931531 RepID=UPI002666A257|nr:Gfo/Idh/MocA family oxidoreductase [Tunicatimonas pelagia]WKN43875.1 Gfo/Idh/MocA family oxidoreductase [Tunicatimonas pelagia]
MQVVKFGVLGVSGFFKKKIAIPTAKSPLIKWQGIASRSLERSQEAADAYGITNAYGSYEELLADEAIEALYIPLPNHVHAEWIKKAADAGKHILCEKPIALSAQEAQEAVEYAEAKGVKVMEAFMYRFHPQWQHALELIRMREIGNVQLVQTFFGYTNADANNIRNQSDKGGGALYDIGCYAISVSRFLLQAEPQRVLSLLTEHADFKTDILSSGTLDFGEARAQFTVGTQTFPYQQVTVHGSGGVISIEIPFNTPADVAARVTVTTSIGTREVKLSPTDQYIAEFEAFARAIREDTTVPTPPTDAVKNMRVLDALFESSRTGGWVAL